MKLIKIKIENYRSIKNESFTLERLLALVGPNNVGKSNLLRALSLIFSKAYPTFVTLSTDDFYKRITEHPIKISLTFSDLEENERKHFRARNKACMRKRGGEPAMYNASEFLNVCLELPYDGRGEFYFIGDDGVPITYGSTAGGRNVAVENKDRDYFPSFLYIPGLRDAGRYFSDSSRQVWGKAISNLKCLINKDQQLKDLLNQVVQKVSSVHEVDNFRAAIKKYLLQFLTDEHNGTDVKLTPINPGDFLCDAQITLDDGFDSTLEAKGEGIKNLAIVALLMLISKTERNLIVAFEEPESFLHPSALYVLNQAMQDTDFVSQLIYSSHSPFLVNVTRPKYVARVYKEQGETKVVQLPTESHWLTPNGQDEIERDIDAQRNLLFFAKAVILVEGPTEFLCLPTFADKLGISLAKKGIALVEVNGKPNLKNYSKYLSDFKIPHVVVYDVDSEDDSLNTIIGALGVPTVANDANFEEMLVTETGETNLDSLLVQAYGDTLTRYKQHYLIRNLPLREQLIKFLTRSKPFAAKYLAETISTKEQVPVKISEIITKALALIS